MGNSAQADTVVVLDFETTGLSPGYGDRAIEIGAVRLVRGEVVEQFQQLMNPGQRVSPFIESYTGISNAMLHDAPPCEEVMRAFAQFIEGFNLVAHNASFDARFLQAEFARAGVAQHGPFACSMLISRRLYPDAPNHKLGTLVHYRSLPNDGTFHRALADAQMTAHLWLGMLRDLETGYGVGSPPFSVMQRLSRTARSKVATLLAGVRSEAASR